MKRSDELLDPSNLTNLVALRFNTPWSARLFGVTLTLAKQGLFSLQDFQRSLIDKIAHHETKGCIDDDEQYYTCWLQALESLLQERQLVSDSNLAKRQDELAHAAHGRHEHQRHHHHHHHAAPLRTVR